MIAIKKVYNNKNFQDSLAALLIYIITFPAFEPGFTIGLDASYSWALNHLFVHDYAALKQIVYPFGPLGFLKDAVVIGNNFEYFLMVYSILKVWFIFIFIRVAEKFNNRKNVSYLIITVILLFFNIDYLFIGLSFIYGFLFLNSRKYFYVVIATLVAFLGLSIKSSIGVSSFSILFVAFILDTFKTRKFRSSLEFAGIVLLIVLVAGLIVFGNLQLLFYYIVNVLRLSVGYSSALSLFTKNNWLLLLIVMACTLLPVLINRENRTKITFLLLLPTLFAMWKHSITRQEYSHLSIFFSFLFLYWGIFVAVSEINIKRILLLAIISISLFYSNMQHAWNFKPKTIDVNGVVNFEKTVVHFEEFKDNYIKASEQNLENSKLNKEVLSMIGNESVDSYPWELSYFSANQELNWKMRRTLQSGSFARWLDQYNAEDFNRMNGPEYLIFHYVSDNWNGKLGSIDNRYLLNDNPLTIYNIFKNYSLRLKTDKFLLLERVDEDNLELLDITEARETRWGQWIDLNGYDFNGLLARMYVFSEQSLLGKIKSFVYKKEEYFIDYLTDDDKIFTFRFIPENAKDGVWLNPFIRNPQNNCIEEKISKVRVRCSNPIFNNERITYRIETSAYLKNRSKTDFNLYFEKTEASEKLPYEYENNFQSKEHTKESTNLVKSNGGYSYTYSILLDTLWKNIDADVNKLTVETDLKYFNEGSRGAHVVSLTESTKGFWKAKQLGSITKQWDYSLHVLELNRDEHNSGVLGIYVWNTGEGNIYIDDFRVKFKIASCLQE